MLLYSMKQIITKPIKSRTGFLKASIFEWFIRHIGISGFRNCLFK